MRHHWSLSVLIVSLTLPFVVCHQTWADEEASGESPYVSLWSQIEQLLADREYGSAANLITDAEMDAELAAFTTQLTADRTDVEVLQRFAKLVREQAASLTPGTPLEIGSINYTVIEFLSDARGDRLIVMAPTVRLRSRSR